MSEFFRDYHAAAGAARRKATLLGLDVAVRKTVEYGKRGFTVSLAGRNDGGMAEIIRPGEPLSQAEIDAAAK